MTLYEAGRPNREPTHPGAILREDVLPALNMKVNAAAKHLRVTRQQLHRILAEQSAAGLRSLARIEKDCE